MKFTRVVPDGRLPGVIYCPACGWKLGAADNPATGYLTECAGCKAQLVMRIERAAILVAVKENRPDTV